MLTMNDTKKITQVEMLEIFKGINLHTFINLKTVTTVKMRKTNNPYFDLIKKVSTANFLLCPDYSKRVNNNRVKESKEANFTPQQPTGKKHISKCVLVDSATETKFYLMVERFVEIKPTVKYLFHGNEISIENFKQYMPEKNNNNSQGLENEVTVLTYGFDSIKGFSLNGQKYEVV